MNVMNSEFTDRITHWIRTLKEDFYEPLGEISFTGFVTDKQLSPKKAAAHEFFPAPPGFVWGSEWEYAWFKGEIILPEEAAGKRIVLNLKPDGESTLFVNGACFGTYRADWINEDHHYFEDNTISTNAAPGTRYEILMETYAGHDVIEWEGRATGPVLPGSLSDTLPDGARRTLGVCTFGIWDEDAYQLYMDVETLRSLLAVQDPSSLRAAKIAEALEKFTLIVDFEQEKEARSASYREARIALSPVLEAENGSTQPVFYAVGNAHLDLAWLWPMAETYRKTARTFAAQLRLIEEYPDYKFIQSQPAAYEMCRIHYPELFARILAAIKGGQWIAEGAMWVEPDTNLSGGEALIRQLIHGKRYYKDVLGVESEILWLPDTFGYTAALPQILAGCGVKYLVTQKIFWSYNEGEQFPCHYFNWEGIDGSRIVSFLPTSYTYRTDPAAIGEVWKNRTQVRDLTAFLFPFGYGDGGGGPCRDHVEYALRQKDLEGTPRVKMAGPKEFFEDMDRLGGPANTYVGELYFSAHRATYTTQAKVKWYNRKCELALREMEMWSCAALSEGREYPQAEADALWKRLMVNQVHDILPGASIGRVYEEAEEDLSGILAEAETITKEALETLSEETAGVSVWNSLSFARRALVSLPEEFAEGAVRADGSAVPIQLIGDEVLALVDLPPCGAVSLRPLTENDNSSALRDPVSDREEVSEEKSTETDARITKRKHSFVMENAKVRAEIDERGEVVSFVLKESGREFAAAPLNHFRFFKDVPRLYDAWDLDSNYDKQEIGGSFDVKVEPVCEGLEAAVIVTGKIGVSSYTQKIRLVKDSGRLEFETEIDWKELHRLLKTAFPVNVYAQNGINEIQFGYIGRPTHRSRAYDKERFEVCNHRYSALADGSHGAAVLNDCKYGISMNGNSLELTLLTASAAPQMRADNRIHHFTYAFTAWEGPFSECSVVRQGYELNVTPPVAPGRRDLSLLSIDRENIILDTLKPAEDGSGDLILRLYESMKSDCTAHITLNFPVRRACLCTMLEEEQEELETENGILTLHFNDFEIRTIRVRR